MDTDTCAGIPTHWLLDNVNIDEASSLMFDDLDDNAAPILAEATNPSVDGFGLFLDPDRLYFAGNPNTYQLHPDLNDIPIPADQGHVRPPEQVADPQDSNPHSVAEDEDQSANTDVPMASSPVSKAPDDEDSTDSSTADVDVALPSQTTRVASRAASFAGGAISRTKRSLKPALAIQKSSLSLPMPPLELGVTIATAATVVSPKHVSSDGAHNPTATRATKKRTKPSGTKSKALASNDRRLQHNKMMRDNRERSNRKFAELEYLLEKLQDPGLEDRPMRNKIQVLERAMLQYATMEAHRAAMKNELLFSTTPTDNVRSELVEVMATASTLLDACDLAIRNMCGTLDWKYGEVWTRNPEQLGLSGEFVLSSAFVSPKNMPESRGQLRHFSRRGRSRQMDSLLQRVAQLGNAVWVPDITIADSASSRSREAQEAGLSTVLAAPLTIEAGLASGQPDAILVLMHADDELLSHIGGVRPYDSESICKLDDLISAVVTSCRQGGKR